MSIDPGEHVALGQRHSRVPRNRLTAAPIQPLIVPLWLGAERQGAEKGARLLAADLLPARAIQPHLLRKVRHLLDRAGDPVHDRQKDHQRDDEQVQRNVDAVRMHQERDYPNRLSATQLSNPDFAKLAEAFGGWAERIETTEQFAPALARGTNVQR